jgi:hypothetical protein
MHFFVFVSSNQAHCLCCLYASQTEDSAPGNSFITVILSTSHHHLAGWQGQFARAAIENGMYPRLNQVAEVAILGDWEEHGLSSIRSPKFAEYGICMNIVTRNIARGTSTLLAFHGRK